MKKFDKNFSDIASVENLLESWTEFLPGKKMKSDVQEFQLRLMDNIFSLHGDLVNGKYSHGVYKAFNISDPKPRNIHKATVRDRLIHHAIYRQLYPFFDKTFIADSYSCRVGKGTHKALNRFRAFARKESHNNTRTVWILKGDIKKFFASVNHGILFGILEKYVPNQNIIGLLREVVGSFSTSPGVGLPLGNLTSQLLVNIYMNEFDQFVKRDMKGKYYIRYADDFVFFSVDRAELASMISRIREFLAEKLKLTLHPGKLYLKTWASGVDFLGWVNFPDHRVLRTATKKRMMRRISENSEEATLQSYLGLLGHGNAHRLAESVKNHRVRKNPNL